MSKDTSVIPAGDYCYRFTGQMKTSTIEGSIVRHPAIEVCPYWSMNGDAGCCSFLGTSDRSGGGMLFDHIKECGLNAEADEPAMAG